MSTSLIPDSAPFDEEQRAWLNGFFAGMLGMQDSPATLDSNTATLDPPAAEVEEDFPWHDAALPIVDRMQLADGKPLPRRMMAAMAQLDCGACGYVCQSYSEAIAAGDETNLTLCSPGGRETSKMLKQLMKEAGGNGNDAANAKSNGAAAAETGWSRANPYSAKLIESRSLNGDGSSKETRHVAIDLGDSGLTYDVGDALGLYPTNCGDLVDQIIGWLDLQPETEVSTRDSVKSLRQALIEDCCLKEPTEELLEELASCASDAHERAEIGLLIDDDSSLENCDVMDLLQMFPSARPSAQSLIAGLGTLNPRLYSIASSLKKHDRQVHLTVGKVSWEQGERIRKGVASTMLAERVGPEESVRIFVHKSHGFSVPSDPNAPMIMVGPGTGIAPFMAFLQERDATAASGKNWLFFGDQHHHCDFLYEQELTDYQASGLLNRIDTAFSRDQEQKVYVQDRMRDNGAEIWQWLENGGYFFVCGDATRMAVDVDRALHEIVENEGNMTSEEAQQYIKAMSQSGRYSRDVY